jgi:hypothetical protein
MKNICNFKIWNLHYTGKSNGANPINISLKTRKNHTKPIKRVIDEANLEIYNSYMKHLSKGALFLHASAISLSDNYILFMGKSGSGKSTIAAFLRDHGARVYSDDFTPVDYQTRQVLPFPLFSNVRRGRLTKLQAKYSDFFISRLKRFGKIRRDHLTCMTDKEFKAYYDYNRELYGSITRSPKSNKKMECKAVFLKKTSNGSPARLEKVNFPHSFNMFINSIHMPLDSFQNNFQKILKLFADFDFYLLESPSAKKSVELILSNFS